MLFLQNRCYLIFIIFGMPSIISQKEIFWNSEFIEKNSSKKFLNVFRIENLHVSSQFFERSCIPLVFFRDFSQIYGLSKIFIKRHHLIEIWYSVYWSHKLIGFIYVIPNCLWLCFNLKIKFKRLFWKCVYMRYMHIIIW